MSVCEKRTVTVKPGGTAGFILSQQLLWDGVFVFLKGSAYNEKSMESNYFQLR